MTSASSWIWRCVYWYVVTGVSDKTAASIFTICTVQYACTHCTLYTEAALFRRNVSNYSPVDMASYPKRFKSLKLLWNLTAIIIFSVTRSGRRQIVIWFSCKVNSQLNCQMRLRWLYLTHSVCETWLLKLVSTSTQRCSMTHYYKNGWFASQHFYFQKL